MNPTDAGMAKRFVKQLNDLSMDETGAQSYRNYADKLLQDISGLEHVATIVLSHRNPGMAAVRLIQHPRSQGLAKMLLNDSDFKILNQLVSIAYMAKQIALKGKRQVTKDDAKTYRYLAKLYKKAVKTLKEKYGYNLSSKHHVKDQFASVRNFINNSDDEFEFDDDFFDDETDELSFGDDDDDGDDGFDIFDEDDDRRIPVDELIAELRQNGYQVIPPAQPAGLPKNYNPLGMPEVNFDFSGKATLEIISDRLLTIAEGLQLVLNRIYGREVNFIDHPRPVAAGNIMGVDISKLSAQQLIQLYNMLGQSLGKSQNPMDFDPSNDDDDDEYGAPSTTGVPAVDLDAQLDALRSGLDGDSPPITAEMHVVSGAPAPDESPDDPAEDPVEPPPVLTDTEGVTSDGEPERPRSVADEFNRQR